jgi:hypothetical protein
MFWQKSIPEWKEINGLIYNRIGELSINGISPDRFINTGVPEQKSL